VKLLLVSKLDRYARAVNTIAKYVQTAKTLGHEVAVFGERSTDIPHVEYSLDVGSFDYAIFVVYETGDFPDLPYLARLLDGMPKAQRVIVDCCGRFNATIRVDHDFNHLEKLDGHQGWEWIEGFETISDTILQPTLRPLRADVRPFLFHAYDPDSVAKPYSSASEAAEAWSTDPNGVRSCGIVYVGHNWQRWSQLKPFLEELEPVTSDVGSVRLTGWDWAERPHWAIELGLEGVNVETDLLERLEVETQPAIPFDQVVDQLGRADFSVVFHRPLFNHLGLVTNRTFEAFAADSIPILMLPSDLIESVYGPQALVLAPRNGVAAYVSAVKGDPEPYWDAVLETRRRLAEHHSFERRFAELLEILDR
jgi:hypothetical protein